jgi:hypothetical protein
MTQEGWRCPTCGSIYAPWMAKCSTCPVGSSVAASTITITQDPDPTCNHRWILMTNGSTSCGRCGGTR